MGATSRIVQLIRRREHRIALFVAIAADAIQIVVLPLFAEGVLSPFDTVLDLAAAFVLSKLVGWHWAFLPSLIAELIPGLDLFPTWTTAVVYVIARRGEPEPEIREEPHITSHAQLPR